MVFPKNNLPTGSQPWTRDVEKRVENLESTFRSAEVNNVTRDSQALSQIRRLDAAVTDAAAAAAEAQAAINGLTSLGADGSTYNINAGNISGGTITGTTIQTNGPGRVIMNDALDALQFTDSSNSVIASIFPGATVGADDGIYMSYGSTPDATADNRIVLENNSVFLKAGSANSGSLSLGASSASIQATGSDASVNVQSNKTFDVWSSSTGGIYGPYSTSINGVTKNNVLSIYTTIGDSENSIDIDARPDGDVQIRGNNIWLLTPGAGYIGTNAAVAMPSLTCNGIAYISGQIQNSTGTYNATVAVAPNLYVASNGNFARATGASSRTVKENIEPLEFDEDAYLSVTPVEFNYVPGFLTGQDDNPRLVGFIAEDFQDAGFNSLINPATENEPIGLKYEKMYMFLHKVVQSQQQTIKALEARVAELENK